MQMASCPAAAPRILGQHTTCRTTSYGSLLSTDAAKSSDQRYRMAHFRELYDKKVNISTSFDPNTLLCGNCPGRHHHILKNNGRSKPLAFILSNQCFPAALPSSGEGDCLAIIRVEDATLGDLVSTFMRMSRGCDIAIGSVVIISSLNHLGRVGTAAYAEDLVDALHTFRQTFSGQIRAVHGFPISTTNITNQFTIRALVEIEAWLDTVDLRRAHSLPETSQYFKDNILASPVDQAESNMCATPSIPLRMPASLFTKDRAAFVGLGWSNIATTLPPMTSLEEKAFLSTLLQELNLEFALQLDISPKVDRPPLRSAAAAH